MGNSMSMRDSLLTMYSQILLIFGLRSKYDDSSNISKFQLSTICHSGNIMPQRFDIFGPNFLLAAVLNLNFS